jgi:hypothetical protein
VAPPFGLPPGPVARYLTVRCSMLLRSTRRLPPVLSLRTMPLPRVPEPVPPPQPPVLPTPLPVPVLPVSILPVSVLPSLRLGSVPPELVRSVPPDDPGWPVAEPRALTLREPRLGRHRPGPWACASMPR